MVRGASKVNNAEGELAVWCCHGDEDFPWLLGLQLCSTRAGLGSVIFLAPGPLGVTLCHCHLAPVLSSWLSPSRTGSFLPL